MAVLNGTSESQANGSLPTPVEKSINLRPSCLVPTPLKDRLDSNLVATAFSVRMVTSVEIAQLAATAGWHTLLIDLEHSTMSLQEASQLCLAANSAGISPIIRVPSNSSEWISRAFDGGAQGIIVPHIESAEEARKVVQYSKFYPMGQRSATYAHPMLRYTTMRGKEATRIINANTMVFAMVESQKGLDNLEEIAAVEGVDVILIGCSDLTMDLGIHQQFDHPLVDEHIKRICQVAKANNKHIGVGALGARPDLLEKFGGYGVRFIMGAADMGLILTGATKSANALEELGNHSTLDCLNTVIGLGFFGRHEIEVNVYRINKDSLDYISLVAQAAWAATPPNTLKANHSQNCLAGDELGELYVRIWSFRPLDGDALDHVDFRNSKDWKTRLQFIGEVTTARAFQVRQHNTTERLWSMPAHCRENHMNPFGVIF